MENTMPQNDYYELEPVNVIINDDEPVRLNVNYNDADEPMPFIYLGDDPNLMNPPHYNIQYVYSSYTEAQARAIKKYRQNNKEKMNALAKKYYDQKKHDEDFLLRKREKAREYYYKRKNNMQNLVI